MSRAVRWQLAAVLAGAVATVLLATLDLVTPAAIVALVTLAVLGWVAFDAWHGWNERRELDRRGREAAARSPEETERLREQARREAAARTRRGRR